MHGALVTASLMLALISPITYIVSIVRGKSRPHRMTRFALMIVLAVTFVGAVAAHGNPGALLLTSIFCLQGIVIFGLSLWRGIGGRARLDWACLMIALLGITAWALTSNPIIGVWGGIVGDFAAYVPAFVKTWRQPRSESPWFYLTSAGAAFLTLITYPVSAVSVFQLYIIGCGLSMTVFIYRPLISRLFDAAWS
ncbi:MAG TPA: hypothetical protein VGS08_01060 [Candidatus Saccharimonadales bacterium]|nr:hypothetical protein [Candidatus Saccharimonadales bacterium]